MNNVRNFLFVSYLKGKEERLLLSQLIKEIDSNLMNSYDLLLEFAIFQASGHYISLTNFRSIFKI